MEAGPEEAWGPKTCNPGLRGHLSSCSREALFRPSPLNLQNGPTLSKFPSNAEAFSGPLWY